MIGIAEDDFGVQIPQQIPSQHALHRGLRAHGHEHRRLDIAVGGMKNPRPRARVGANRLKLEAEHSSATVPGGMMDSCRGPSASPSTQKYWQASRSFAALASPSSSFSNCLPPAKPRPRSFQTTRASLERTSWPAFLTQVTSRTSTKLIPSPPK